MLAGSVAGSAMASASAMGSILGPEMEKGYSRGFWCSNKYNFCYYWTGYSTSNILIVYSLASDYFHCCFVFSWIYPRYTYGFVFNGCCYVVG